MNFHFHSHTGCRQGNPDSSHTPIPARYSHNGYAYICSLMPTFAKVNGLDVLVVNVLAYDDWKAQASLPSCPRGRPAWVLSPYWNSLHMPLWTQLFGICRCKTMVLTVKVSTAWLPVCCPSPLQGREEKHTSCFDIGSILLFLQMFCFELNLFWNNLLDFLVQFF